MFKNNFQKLVLLLTIFFLLSNVYNCKSDIKDFVSDLKEELKDDKNSDSDEDKKEDKGEIKLAEGKKGIKWLREINKEEFERSSLQPYELVVNLKDEPFKIPVMKIIEDYLEKYPSRRPDKIDPSFIVNNTNYFISQFPKGISIDKGIAYVHPNVEIGETYHQVVLVTGERKRPYNLFDKNTHKRKTVMMKVIYTLQLKLKLIVKK